MTDKQDFDWTKTKAYREAHREFANGNSEESEEATRVEADPWPVLAEDALCGLAGDIVQTIDPYTEADRVATLLNTLTGSGNCINSSAHA